jgi:exodeoxyribonuclease-5
MTDGMMITSTNAERAKLNKIARRSLGRAEAGPEAGDLAICLRNHHSSGLMNGHRMVLQSVVDRGGGMLRVDMTAASVPRDQFGAERTMGTRDAPQSCVLLDYGYAMTCHKAQGSQARRVVVSLDGIAWLANKGELGRWLYTASSRASESLVLIQ